MAFSASQWRSESLLVDVDEMTGIHTPEPSKPIIDGVLRRGHILMLTGPPKAGKSWGMGHLAYAVATGTDWMGFKCHEGTVCYVDTELDPKSLFVRLDRIRSQLGLMDSHGNIMAMSLRGKAIDAETLVNTITDAYGEQPPALVIIDSIYSIETGDENNAGDMRGMMMQLGRLASLGSAIGFAHHHAKGNAGTRNVIDRGSGSGVFGRFVDAMVDLTPVEPDKEQREMLDARYDERAVPMRMSFVLREFADPGTRNVVFDYPLIREVDGDFMDDAPEQGTAEAARRKGGESNRRRNDHRWGSIDEALGRAVNQCYLDGVPATRKNVAERATIDGKPVTNDNIKRWTRNDASTKWRVVQDGRDWVLQCSDESWSSSEPENA